MFGYELPNRTDRVICCPEDCKRCDVCSTTPDSMCGDCEVALCSTCGDAFKREPRVIEMGLCNDNVWGYACHLIYKYKVRWLEAAIVTPCWTSFLVYYVEGDQGHLLNEDLQDQKGRTCVRGHAISYPMPWEDIVRELRDNYLDAEFQDIPRREECLNYIMKVHLNVAGQNMTKHIRQLCVRPFVLLLLLEFRIDRQRTAFRGKGSPA